MFTAYPTHDPLRPLKLQAPASRGEDCFALQTMLVALGEAPGELDAVFGTKTDAAVRSMQAKLGLTIDGKVGPATWTTGVDVLAKAARDKHGIARGLMHGQLRHESSFYGGNYSRPPREDGNYDTGVAMRNTEFTHPRDGFNVPGSIAAMAEVDRKFYDLFEGVKPNRRRWTLTAGAWNAWAYACWYAKREGAIKVTKGMTLEPGPKAAKTFADYMTDVTKFLVT